MTCWPNGGEDHGHEKAKWFRPSPVYQLLFTSLGEKDQVPIRRGSPCPVGNSNASIVKSPDAGTICPSSLYVRRNTRNPSIPWPLRSAASVWLRISMRETVKTCASRSGGSD